MSKRASAVVAAHRARAARRPPSLKKRIKTFLALTALAVFIPAAVAAIYVLIVFLQVSKTVPSVAEIGSYQPSEGTRIYYADGPLMAVIKTENRQPVKLTQISQHLIDATIATEDSRFYEHQGVDYHGIVRAVYANVSHGDARREGASTITQQLARNINELGLSRQKKLSRKIAEAILAVKIEQTFTKQEILELYLNQIYYGAGAYGAEAAALTYFHRHAKNLSLSQAALLAGLPQSPSYYSTNREAALKRRDQVLGRMVDTSKITPEQEAEAKLEPLHIYRAEAAHSQILGAPYFVQWVVNQLVNDPEGKFGYGSDAMLSGWDVYTTLDSRIQKAAEETLAAGIRHNGMGANQAALICIDPHTGAIRAMVGGLDHKRDEFNIVTQGKRQPGSSFKPILYTAGFDTDKFDLDTRFRDDPDFPGMRRGNTWYPKNYSGRYTYNRMTVLEAIKQSTNTIAVKAAMTTGLDTVISYAHRLGISTDIDAYPTLALGASAVRPIDLCSVYTVFANNGKRALPMGIARITSPSTGETIADRSPEVVDTGLKPHTLEMINFALQQVVLEGTGAAAADVPHAHGKTGTTSDNRDAWFAGYTPELTTVIWAAHENRSKSGKLNRKEPFAEMPGTTGGHLCAPIWKDFMLKAIPIQQQVNKASQGGLPQSQEAKEQAKEHKKPEHPKIPLQTVPANGQPGMEHPVVIPPNPGEQPAPDNGLTTTTTTGPPSPDVAPAPTEIPVRAAPAAGPEVRERPANVVRPADPGTRIAAPTPPRVDPRDEYINVDICVDSGRRATQWCPSTVEKRMRRRDVPGRCRIHKPPPGE